MQKMVGHVKWERAVLGRIDIADRAPLDLSNLTVEGTRMTEPSSISRGA